MPHANGNDTAMQQSKDVSRFVELCALQLRLALTESGENLDALSTAALATRNGDANELIERLQFVDRFMQRLGNVQSSLEQLAQRLNTDAANPNREDWEQFLRHVRETYTMEQERDVFDATLGLRNIGEDPAAAAKTEGTLMLFTEETSDV